MLNNIEPKILLFLLSPYQLIAGERLNYSWYNGFAFEFQEAHIVLVSGPRNFW